MTRPAVRKRSKVAPFTGAWIEIRVRRLMTTTGDVAPFTGAWIEMFLHARAAVRQHGVAPFTGAWIEMSTKAPHG